MGKLILVRHGESEANLHRVFAQDDTPLTELGRRQAADAARRIAERFRPSGVVSSQFVRARQTAQIIAAELGLDVRVVPRLHERDFGILTGLPYEAFKQLAGRDPSFDPKKPWAWTPEGAESAEDVQRRIMGALEELRAQNPDAELAVVCHGAAMLSVLAYMHGGWNGEEIPANCGLLVLAHEAGRFTGAETIGETAADVL